MAAKAKVAAAQERRARAREGLKKAIALISQADTDIEVSDLTDEQIKERSS